VFTKFPYSFGITLQNLTVVTTNEDWEPQYIDRTDKANCEKPLYKHLKLHGLAIYWISNETEMLSLTLDEGDIEKRLNGALEEMAKQSYILKPCKCLVG